METFAAVHLMLSYDCRIGLAAMGSDHPLPRKEKKKRRLRGAFGRQLTERIGIDTLRRVSKKWLRPLF